MTSRSSWVVVVLALAPAFALAQSLTVTPNAGQNQSQMQKDVAECQAIAQQSGAGQPASPARGGRLRGAAAGRRGGGTIVSPTTPSRSTARTRLGPEPPPVPSWVARVSVRRGARHGPRPLPGAATRTPDACADAATPSHRSGLRSRHP